MSGRYGDTLLYIPLYIRMQCIIVREYTRKLLCMRMPFPLFHRLAAAVILGWVPCLRVPCRMRSLQPSPGYDFDIMFFRETNGQKNPQTINKTKIVGRKK